MNKNSEKSVLLEYFKKEPTGYGDMKYRWQNLAIFENKTINISEA